MIKGTNAINKLNEVREQKKNALQYIKAGTSLNVCIPSTEEVAQVYVHNVYGVFNSFQCENSDLVCKAVDYLYKQANNTTDEKKKEELKQKAYQLKAKPRFLFGFYNLETGEPILIDLSKKQGQSIFSTINEYRDELGTYAFKLAKLDGGVMSLTPILKGLTDAEKSNFEAVKGKEIEASLYENAIFKRDREGQIEDLTKFGFPVNAILGNDQPVVQETNNQLVEEDDLPF